MLKRRIPVLPIARVALLMLVFAIPTAACSSDTSIDGTYANDVEGTITLDGGTWTVTQGDSSSSGTYTVEGTTITFLIDGQPAGAGKIDGDTLTDPDGKIFTKT